MGSIPNGSAPLQACARQIFKFTLPGRTGKAQVLLQPLKLRRTSLQHPAVKTYFRELTLLDVSKFSNPSTTFDRVALHPPKLGFRGPRPGPRLQAHPAPLEPSGQPGLTRLRPSTPR